MYEDASEPQGRVVAISPDLGVKYINTLYNDKWCDEKFGSNWRSIKFNIEKNETEFVEVW